MYIHKLLYRDCLFLLLYFISTAVVFASEDEFDVDYTELSLEELLQVRVVSLASGFEQTVAKAPSVTSVITARDIQEMGAVELSDVLETVPGFHVARSYINYNPIYTVRGIYSSFNPQILFMINGTPISTLQDGNRGVGWGGMPIHSIEKIEIIRGPGSAVYGADAFSGVINIITKNADDIDGTEMGIRGGSYNTKDAWVLHGTSWDDWNVAFTLEMRDTDGHDGIIQEDAQTFYDGIFGTHASLAPGSVNLQRRNLDTHLDISKGHWRFRAGYQGRYSMGTAAGVAQALDNHGRQEEKRTFTDITYQNSELFSDWNIESNLSYFNSRYRLTENLMLYPPGAFGDAFPNGFIGNPGVSENHTRFNIFGLYSGIKNHLIRLGVGYHYSDIYKVIERRNFGLNPHTEEEISPVGELVDVSDTTEVFLPEGDRKNWHLFIQDTWQFAEKWELTSGLRYDNYSDFGSTLNPRLSLIWETTPFLTTKLLYGQAFRAPAFSELYTVNNPTAQGNPSLKPETNETWELAFSYEPTEALYLGLNLFTYKWRDAILVEPDPNATADNPHAGTLQNAGSQSGHGVELETHWRITSKLSILGNYAFQKSIDTDNNDVDAGNAPHHQAYLRVDWQFKPQWYLNTQLHWLSERKRVTGDPRPALDGYSLVDLTLRHEGFKDHWDFALGIRNLFDEEAFEPSPGPDSDGIIGIPYDLPLADRNYFAEVRYHF